MAIQKTPRLGLDTFTAGSDAHPNRTAFNAERTLLDAVLAIAMQDTLANRPTAGKSGRLFWDTAAERLYWDNGTAWKEVTTNGGAGAGAPILPGVAATEGTSSRSARADHTHLLALATASVNGAMSAADKTKLDAATAAATAGTLVRRSDGGGYFDAPTPTSTAHVATKGYVDAQVGTRAATAHTHVWADLTDKPVTFAPSAHNHDGSNITTGTISDARIANATAALDGLMPKADKAKLDAATSAPTPSTLMMTDAAGRSQSAAPSVGADIANKTYVDAQVGTRAATAHTHGWADLTSGVPATFTPSAHTHTAADVSSGTLSAARLPAATTGAAGSMSAADKAKLDAATYAPTGSTLVQRASTGVIQVETLLGGKEATNKDYVDAAVATKADSAHTHGWADLTGKPVTFAPIIGATSTTAKAGNYAPSWTDVTAKPATFTPSAHVHSGADITTGTISDARIANATAALDGLMPKADKAKLDAATSAPTASVLAMRNSAGRIQVADPGTDATAATPKSYVDTKANASHTHSTSDLTPGVLTMDKLRLTGTADASPSSIYHAFQIGDTAGANLIMDGNEIMTRDNGVAIETYFAAGMTSGVAPVNTASVTRKDYVDAAVATKADSAHTHGWADLTGKPVTFAPIIGTTSTTAKAGNYAPSWTDVTAKPSWIGSSKPTYAASEILNGTKSVALEIIDVNNRVDNRAPISQVDALEAKVDSRVTGDTVHSALRSPSGTHKISVHNSGYVWSLPVYNTNAAAGSYRAVWVNDSGVIGYNLSSRKFKTSESPYTVPLDTLMAVEPKWFQYKEDVATLGADVAPFRVNFIAEDLHDAGLTEYVSYDGNGTERENAQTINEQLMVSALWSFARQHQVDLDELKRQVKELGGR